MWEIRSSDLGYHLYKGGQLKADLYGFYRDWVKIVEFLNGGLTPAAVDTALCVVCHKNPPAIGHSTCAECVV